MEIFDFVVLKYHNFWNTKWNKLKKRFNSCTDIEFLILHRGNLLTGGNYDGVSIIVCRNYEVRNH